MNRRAEVVVKGAAGVAGMGGFGIDEEDIADLGASFVVDKGTRHAGTDMGSADDEGVG